MRTTMIIFTLLAGLAVETLDRYDMRRGPWRAVDRDGRPVTSAARR